MDWTDILHDHKIILDQSLCIMYYVMYYLWTCSNLSHQNFTVVTEHIHKPTISICKTYNFRSKDEQTTDTEEAAMAAEAIQGCRDQPNGTNIPRI